MIDRLYCRYIGASAASAGVDFGLFLTALSAGVPPAFAAALGYCGGIVCHWIISTRAVFIGRVADGGARRRQQQVLFALAALLGLGLTTAIVGVGSLEGFDPRLAKAAAMLVSFQATYMLRRKVVFA
jgi:putative flippase GtrA